MGCLYSRHELDVPGVRILYIFHLGLDVDGTTSLSHDHAFGFTQPSSALSRYVRDDAPISWMELHRVVLDSTIVP